MFLRFNSFVGLWLVSGFEWLIGSQVFNGSWGLVKHLLYLQVGGSNFGDIISNISIYTGFILY